MKLDEQDFLRLVEANKSIVFFDMESKGLRGDYGSLLVATIKPYNQRPMTFVVDQPGKDNKLARNVKEALEEADCWVTYYGKGFDVPMLNTRLARWGMHPVEKRPHIDMYYTLKANILTERRSQGHLLEWIRDKRQKMSVSAEDWNEVLYNRDIMRTMVKRCESDTEGLEALYKRFKHLIRDIKR